MLPDQLFYNTGIFTYVWLLSNNKPKTHKNRVMLLDGRICFEKEPKSFGNKRNRISAAHMATIKDYYQRGWEKGFEDDYVKLFNTTDFAFHKVSVVFWQTDERDDPGFVTEPYTKALTPANIKNQQTFYESDLEFFIVLRSSLRSDLKSDLPPKAREERINFTLAPDELFSKRYEREIKAAFKQEIKTLTKTLKTAPERSQALKRFTRELDATVVFTHRHYVSDTEYIPFGQDIEAFLKREIDKPVIRWNDSPQLGYEILPNKYFYKYESPKPADELLREFWNLEKAAENMLRKL